MRNVDFLYMFQYNIGMDKITVIANAKLNLYLDVKGTLEGGYHDLDMLMVTVNLGDVITVHKRSDTQVNVVMDGKPAYDENTAYRTALLVAEYTGMGMDVNIIKRIPVGAGMGGSSADSAGVLNACMKLFALPREKAEEIALQVGSDVVYMMSGGIMRAQGRGEILTPVQGLDKLREKYFVVAQKCAGGSTAQIYKHFDTLGIMPHNGFDRAVEALASGRGEGALYNALTLSAVYHCPSIVNTMYELKCYSDATSMTGSGSAVFAVFNDFARAKECYESLHNYKYKGILHIV